MDTGIGKRIRQLRIDTGLSVREVAEALGIAQSTYREWEQGRKISGEPYYELCELFSISLSELLTGKRPSITRDLARIEEIARDLRQRL